MATTAQDLGCDVTVVGPDHPGDVMERAQALGLSGLSVGGHDRPSYLRALRTWEARERTGLLWCNGLVPALATAGHGNRVVHLHQVPRNHGQRFALQLARLGARQVYVPSHLMARSVRAASVLHNWTPDLPPARRVSPAPDGHTVLGFLGRYSPGKGLDVLANTLQILDALRPGQFSLVLAGDGRGVSSRDTHTIRSCLATVKHLVHDHGWMSPSEFFTMVDLAVFPSVWPETFGLVVAEAMAAGVPFVISDAGALPEVAGQEHRWVARATDPQSLAVTILAALTEQGPRELAAARQRWHDEYSPTAGRRRLASELVRLGVLSEGCA